MEMTSSDSSRVPGLAVAGLVLGIVAVIVPILGLIAAVLALVFGVKAKNRIDTSRGTLAGSGLAIAGIICGAVGLVAGLAGLFIIAAVSIPSFVGFSVAAKESRLASNMVAVRTAAEEFAAYAGHYPATINTNVKQVLADLGQESDDERSIADAGMEDPVAPEDINSTGNAFLTITLENPWSVGTSSPVVATWSGEPEWSEDTKGMVWYVPIGVAGSHAAGFEIYGTSEWDMYEEVLSPEK
jgi:type II secretory pathway pseudopilin PulG